MNCYLGIDIGTTGVKAVIFDSKGSPLGIGLVEYTLETPEPDIVELDAEVYWEAAKKALVQAVDSAKIAPADIRSLAVTGQAETLIVVDKNNVPLRKAIVWLDNRAVEEAAELERKFSAEVLFRMSGQTEMLPCWPAAKILWLKKNEPEIFAAAARYLMVEDFFIARLTGKYATCNGLMPSSLYYDIRTDKYDPVMLAALGISEAQLPELKNAGEIAGVCIENDSVICAGTPVAVAPIDHVCGNLGSGCSQNGMLSETTGCTLAVCAVFRNLVYDEERRLSTYLGSKKGDFVLLPWGPTAGMLLKHFRDEFGCGMDYNDFSRAAAEIPAGSDGLILLPHCAGAISPDCNPEARGAAYGITLAHKKGHWARAIMESVAYLLRDNIEVMKKLGAEIKEIRSLGGASKSDVWMQIKADVLNITVTTTECEEATSLGAAILGAVACGDFCNTEECVGAMVRIRKRYEPGENAKLYPEYFKKYQHLNKMLMPTFGGKL